MKYTKLTLSFLFLFSITIYSQDYNQTKKNIIKSIENHEEEIIKISDKIWELAETAFNEHESSKLLQIMQRLMVLRLKEVWLVCQQHLLQHTEKVNQLLVF